MFVGYNLGCPTDTLIVLSAIIGFLCLRLHGLEVVIGEDSKSAREVHVLSPRLREHLLHPVDLLLRELHIQITNALLSVQ